MSISDLLDEFPGITITDDYCGTFYFRWERDVAKPYLEAQGYTDVRFYDIERDSFGPLIRGVSAQLNGRKHEWLYG